MSRLLPYIGVKWAVGGAYDEQRQPEGVKGQLQLVRYVSKEKHYVNDTFVIWQHGFDKLKTFLDFLHSFHRKVQFTVELEDRTSPICRY